MTSTVFRRISDTLLSWIKNSLIFKLFYYIYLKFKGYFEGSYFVKLMYFFKEKITASQYTPKESMSIPDRVLKFILEKSIGFLNKNKEAYSVQLIVKIKEMTYKKLVSLNSITLGVYTLISAVLYLLKGSSNLSIILGLLSLGFFLVFYSLKKDIGILSKYLTGDEKLSKIEIIVFGFLGLVPGIFLNAVGFYLATALALGIVFMISVLKETFLAVGAYIFAVVFLPDALTLLVFGITILVIFIELIFYDSFEYNVTPVGNILFLLLSIFTIRTVFSVDRSGSIRDFVLNVGSIVFIFLWTQLKIDKEKFRKIVYFLLFTAFLSGLYGIVQYIIGVPMESGWVDPTSGIETRVFATFENPNIFAEYLIMIIPVGYAVMLREKKFKNRILTLGMGSTVFASLLFTFSRGGWLGAAAGAFLFLFMYQLSMLLKFIPVALMGLMLLPASILSRIASIGSLQDASNFYRMQIWEKSVEIIKDYPLTGVGLGFNSFRKISAKYITEADPYHAHNTYLELAVEVGVIGLAMVIFLGLKMMGMVHHILKVDKHNGVLMLGFFAGLISLMVHGMAEHVLYNPKIILLFWFYVGCINSIYAGVKKERLEYENINVN
jgi:O-antigen ligase